VRHSAACDRLKDRSAQQASGVVLAQSSVVTFAPMNPVPSVTQIVPSQVEAGSSSFTLTVNGGSFASGAIVRIGGADRTTTFVSQSQLAATVSADDVFATGARTVTVFNPAPGGGTSNGAQLAVIAPQEVVVDNGQAGTSFVGQWTTTTDASAYNGTALVAPGFGASSHRWTPTIPSARPYQLFVRWPIDSTLSQSTLVTIVHASGFDTFVVDQGVGGGAWQYVGTFIFPAGTAGYVEVRDADGRAAADAIRLVPVTP